MHSPLQLPRQLVWPDHTQEDFRRMLPREAFETLLEMWDIVTEDEDQLPHVITIGGRNIFVNLATFLNTARYLTTILTLWPRPEKHGAVGLCERLVGTLVYNYDGRPEMNVFQLLMLNMVGFLARASMKNTPKLEKRYELIDETINEWQATCPDDALSRCADLLMPLREKAATIDIPPLLPEPKDPHTLENTPEDNDILTFVYRIGDEREFERLLSLYRSMEDQQALLDWLRAAEAEKEAQDARKPAAETISVMESRSDNLPF